MNQKDFYTIYKSGKCPVCENKNFSYIKDEYGTKFYYCDTCNGIPAYCNGSIYIYNTFGLSFVNCQLCGTSDTGMNHELAWPG